MERVKTKGETKPNLKQVYVVSNSKGLIKSEEYRDRALYSDDVSNYTVVEPSMFAYNPSRLNVGSIARLKSNEPGLVSPMYIVFSVNREIVLPEYFEFLVKSSFVKSKIDLLKEEGARFRFDYKRWDRIQVPIPSLREQQLIIEILNKFDVLSNDLIVGLPAEIEARQKQYEYYRDKLLTFKDISEK